MSDTGESVSESIRMAWKHLDSEATPELRRWLQTGQPVALHQDLMLIAVPNTFTRNQLENKLRTDIEAVLSDFFNHPSSSRSRSTSRWPPRSSLPAAPSDGYDCHRLRSLGPVRHRPLPPPGPLPSDDQRRLVRAPTITARHSQRPRRRRSRGRADRSLRHPTRVRHRRRPFARRAPTPPGDRHPAEPEVLLRDLRHRRLEPLRPRRRHRRRREPGQVVQPADHLRRVRASARPTCCTPSGTTSATTSTGSGSATSRPRN